MSRHAPGDLIYHILNRGAGGRANLVDRAEQWRWSSLRQTFFDPTIRIPRIDLTSLPLAGVREDWLEWVNLPQTAAEEQAVLHAITHSRPFGGREWTRRMEKRLSLGPLRPRGRPVKIRQATAKCQ